MLYSMPIMVVQNINIPVAFDSECILNVFDDFVILFDNLLVVYRVLST